MDKYKSKLIFKKYIVDEIVFKYNKEFKNKPVEIIFDIFKKINYENDKQMNVSLKVKIFEENEKYPFYMMVSITGFFEIENNDEGINFEPNAIAILYPFIRSIVSTYTASANVMPLILPVINVNKYLEDKQIKDN